MKRRIRIAIALLVIVGGCKQQAATRLYEEIAVARRDLDVRVSAAGVVEPVLTVDVKSKASGEIIEMRVETGDEVRTGLLVARFDPRLQENTLAQAEANLDVARAQLQNAEAQKRRSEQLFKSQSIAETEYETVNLNHATARAAVVRAEAELETARDGMEDTSLRAPMDGTILQKNVELGTVISSPTRDVGGGTVLFRMANLDTMQVRALVDETDIGKITPGAEAIVTVEAYSSRTFRARVLKIEPQAVAQQNVTMFPVLIGIDNPEHLLRPGMNTEVEIGVGRRQSVLTIPNAALRTSRDVASAAQVLGLDPESVQAELARGRASADSAANAAAGGASGAAGSPVSAQPAANRMTLPSGREVTLPEGVSADQVRSAMHKRMSGGELQPAERALLGRVFGQSGGGRSSGSGGAGATGGAFGGTFIVFKTQAGRPVPVEIRTGLTDFDHVEVMQGLAEGDTVLVLPSASLLASQEEFRDRVQRMQGNSGLPGTQQQQTQRPASGTGSQRPQSR